MIGCRAATGASDSADVERTCPSGSGRTGAWLGVMLVLLPRGYPDVPSYAPSYALSVKDACMLHRRLLKQGAAPGVAAVLDRTPNTSPISRDTPETQSRFPRNEVGPLGSASVTW